MWPAPLTSAISAWGTRSRKLPGPLLAQDVAAPAAHQEGRDPEGVGGVVEPAGVHHRGAGLVLRAQPTPHEGRVPVPHPASVVAPAQVLRQAGEVLGAGAVGVVGGDGVGGLLQRGEAVDVADHERRDALPALDLDPVGHVDEHQGPGQVLLHRSVGQGDHRGQAAEGGADQHRRVGERGGDGPDVAGEGVEGVVAVGRPVALAVAPQVDRQGPPPGVDQDLPGPRPRVAGLAATVEEDDGGPVLGPTEVGGQRDAAGPLDPHRQGRPPSGAPRRRRRRWGRWPRPGCR